MGKHGKHKKVIKEQTKEILLTIAPYTSWNDFMQNSDKGFTSELSKDKKESNFFWMEKEEIWKRAEDSFQTTKYGEIDNLWNLVNLKRKELFLNNSKSYQSLLHSNTYNKVIVIQHSELRDNKHTIWLNTKTGTYKKNWNRGLLYCEDFMSRCEYDTDHTAEGLFTPFENDYTLAIDDVGETGRILFFKFKNPIIKDGLITKAIEQETQACECSQIQLFQSSDFSLQSVSCEDELKE